MLWRAKESNGHDAGDYTGGSFGFAAVRDYTLENWGGRQEEKYLQALWTKFDAILKNPEKWRGRPDLFPGCQIAAEGRHVILFRVQKRTLQIVRILHSSMDFSRHIPKDL